MMSELNLMFTVNQLFKNNMISKTNPEGLLPRPLD